MARKLNIPSVVGLSTEGLPFGITVFLQAVQDAFNVVDNSVVYKDSVNVNITQPRLRAVSAQGQGFSVSGVNVASGDDYAVLVSNVRTILEDLTTLRNQVNTLKDQIKGT